MDVLCVDDGTRERLPLSRLRVLEEQFAQLPCQALCCALAGVQPVVNVLSGQGKYLCLYLVSVFKAVSKFCNPTLCYNVRYLFSPH